MERTRLDTTAADGSPCVFYYEMQRDELSGCTLQFRVYDSETATDEYFEWVLMYKDNFTAQSIVVEKHDDMRYGAKGIPDALFPRAAQTLNKIIQSSPFVKANTDGNISDFSNSRSVEATKMWKRLESKDLASYDPDRDVYIIEPRNEFRHIAT